jgi:hypothetical protein
VSDFQVDTMVAGRNGEGRPMVQAKVHNTGRRALDMNGTLSLAGGPGGVYAGPFTVTPGTTLEPGDIEPVTALLNRQISGGPWQATLLLTSGRIHHTVTATITFRAESGSTSTAVLAQPTSNSSRTLLIAGLLAAAVLVGMCVVVRRRRHQRSARQTA